MPFSEDFKERVKNSIDIVDYIGRDISLHKKNFDDYRGTVGKAGNSGESLIVSPSQQLWHDTKNQCGGDVFSWIAYHEGLDKQKDFPEILRIAAEFAAIELEGLTDEDRALIEEGKEVTATLNEVTEIYHQNLLSNPEAIKQVSDNWGFDLEVIKAFKIGYATGADLKHIDKQRLVKAGLIYKNSSQEFFIHRIMFPYLIKGNTVYFIGRRTDKTPLDKQGKQQGKYKKLLTHDNNPDVSKHVNNKFLFGEDNIKGSDWVLIAEGITDAISAQVRGYPVISAVTTSIKKAETDRVSKVIGERPVKICLDIDSVTQAGQNGARLMAEKLTVRGNEVSILSLPDPEDKKDYDLNDYFRKHEKEDFDKLIEEAPDYWDYILPNKETYTSKPITARLKALKKFISDDLREMPEELWRAFIENEVVKAFSLTKKDAKAVIDASEKSRNNSSAKEEDSEEEGHEKESSTNGGSLPPLEDRLSAYPEHIIQKANDILDNGDPFQYICDTWNELHVGDENLGEMLACSVASSQVLNIDIGLHEKPSGDSESGKSQAMTSMGKLCPVWKFRMTTFSPKVLYYMPDLLPGTIIYTDDVDLGDKGVISTIKKVTGDFEEPTIADTIIDGKSVNMKIPPRINFWMSSVDTIDDVQLGTRFIYSNTEAGTEHDREVNHKQRGKALGKPLEEDNERLLICRCMFEYICDQLYYVFSPYLFVSTWTEESRKRNLEKFISVLFAVTVFKYRQRETLHGNLVGTREDWDRAVSIYSHVAQNNSCLLSDEEISILYSIHEMSEAFDDGVPHKRLLNYMKEEGRFSKSDSTLKRILIGDIGSGRQGFKEKVPGFSYETVSKPKLDERGFEIKGAGNTKTLCYTYDGDLFEGIQKDTDIVEIIKKGTFVNCDYGVAAAFEELFRKDPHKAHTLKKNTATLENWKRSLRNQKDLSEITRNHQNSKPLNSEKQRRKITNNNNNNNNNTDNNKLRNQKNNISGVAGKSMCVVEGSIDEETHAKIMNEISVNSVNSEPTASDHALNFETPILNSKPTDSDHILISDESESIEAKMYLLPLLRQALVKLAKEEYHSTVLDLDEFVRDFNHKTPDYKKTLGALAVENESRKLKMKGWRV